MGNMHLVTGFAGREHVTAADHGSFYAALYGSGTYLLDKGKKFELTKISNNLIRVFDGDMLMQGRHCRIEDDAYVELTVENGTTGYKRKDLVVCRYTKDSDSGVEDCNIIILRGDPVGAEPADPAYVTGDIIKDGAITNDVPLYRLNLNGLEITSIDSLLPAVIPVIPEKLSEHAESIAVLQAALAGSTGAKIQTGTYTGTGTSGSGSPNALTFEFVPKLVFITANNYYSISGSSTKFLCSGLFVCSRLSSDYKQYGYFDLFDNISAYDSSAYAKLSGKTLTWYCKTITDQLNATEVGGYHWLAIG